VQLDLILNLSYKAGCVDEKADWTAYQIGVKRVLYWPPQKPGAVQYFLCIFPFYLRAEQTL
jgi:hypothetical protein